MKKKYLSVQDADKLPAPANSNENDQVMDVVARSLLLKDALTLTLDMQGVVTHVSPAAQHIFDLQPYQCRLSSLLHPSYAEEACLTSSWNEKARLQLRTRAAEYRWFSVKAISYQDHILVWLEALDEIIRMEQELAKAKQKLREASQERQSFLRHISHEVRTPLNAILGFSELIERCDTVKTDAGEYLQYIRTSGQQLLGKLGDMIDLSANRPATPVLQRDIIMDYVLLNSTLTHVQNNASMRGIVMYQNPSLPRVSLLCDVKLMCKALTYIYNATISRLDSGDMVRVSACVNDNQEYQIIVEDDGAPLTEAQRQHLQAIAGNSENYYYQTDMFAFDDMTYILAIEAIELHGGTFDVRCVAEKGTIITVTLPKSCMQPGSTG